MITRAINVAKTAKDDLGSYIAIGIIRNAAFPCCRKHRNDNWSAADNRNTSAIHQLWGKCIYYRCNMCGIITQHKCKKAEEHV